MCRPHISLSLSILSADKYFFFEDRFLSVFFVSDVPFPNEYNVRTSQFALFWYLNLKLDRRLLGDLVNSHFSRNINSSLIFVFKNKFV